MVACTGPSRREEAVDLFMHDGEGGFVGPQDVVVAAQADQRATGDKSVQVLGLLE
jgi:hypothetical protein